MSPSSAAICPPALKLPFVASCWHTCLPLTGMVGPPASSLTYACPAPAGLATWTQNHGFLAGPLPGKLVAVGAEVAWVAGHTWWPQSGAGVASLLVERALWLCRCSAQGWVASLRVPLSLEGTVGAAGGGDSGRWVLFSLGIHETRLPAAGAWGAPTPHWCWWSTPSARGGEQGVSDQLAASATSRGHWVPPTAPAEPLAQA